VRVIIAGSRTGVSIEDVERAVQTAPFLITTVLCGMAQGADLCGRHVAKQKGWAVEEYPADWKNLGRVAGFQRNLQMAQKAEALIAVWDGKSNGTKHMIATAERFGLLVHVHKVE
jgi:ornithine carbamoyltransferase